MRKLRKALRIASSIAGTACLVSGFVSARQWELMAGALVIFMGCIFDLKWPSGWISPVALVVSVGISAAGLFTNAPAWLMLLASTFALATWDLALLDHALADNLPTATTVLLEKRHYQNLAIITGSGVLVMLAGQVIQLPIPFVIMMALVIVLLYSLLRLWSTFSE